MAKIIYKSLKGLALLLKAYNSASYAYKDLDRLAKFINCTLPDFDL